MKNLNRKHASLNELDVQGLIESALRVASSQHQSSGGDPVANVGNELKVTDVDVRKNNQRSDTDQDLYTDKDIWVLNIPIQYCPVLINQEDFDETESATAQSRGILTEAENH